MNRDEYFRIKREIKEEIKELSEKQKKEGFQNVKWARAGEITALLNFYHEFRGSDYRHGKEGVKLRGGWHDYCKKYKELKEKYEIPMLICVSA